MILVFVATGDVEENIRRVRVRGLAGGHSAPEEELRAIYERSMANLESTFDVFEHIELYDSSIRGVPPRLVGKLVNGRFTPAEGATPRWLPESLKSRS